MIIYFSGTGNSEYIAQRIGIKIEDECINLFSKIRDNDDSTMHSDKPWVVVAPTYAWRIPRIVSDWLKKTTLSGHQDIYFVMSCGENTGNAATYVRRLSDSVGLHYAGCASIVMPENYLALFETPTHNEALSIIKKADHSIEEVSRLIQRHEKINEPKVTMKDRIQSGIVNDIFYPVVVHAKKFRVEENCISCGECARLCPLNNIMMKEGKLIWGNECTHCMACIARCPKEAIEYGEHSVGLPRYTFDKIKLD